MEWSPTLIGGLFCRYAAVARCRYDRLKSVFGRLLIGMFLLSGNLHFYVLQKTKITIKYF